jgi:hypothetical protein
VLDEVWICCVDGHGSAPTRTIDLSAAGCKEVVTADSRPRPESGVDTAESIVEKRHAQTELDIAIAEIRQIRTLSRP